MSGMGAARAKWNATLLSSVLPLAYCTLLQHTCGTLGSGAGKELAHAREQYWRLWPGAGGPQIGGPWSELAAATYRQVATTRHACIYAGPALHRVAQTLYHESRSACIGHTGSASPWGGCQLTASCASRAVLHACRRVAKEQLAWSDAHGGRWLAPAQGVLPDEQCAAVPQLPAALVGAGVPLMLPPQGVAALMLQYMQPAPPLVTPAAARAALRAASGPSKEAGRSAGAATHGVTSDPAKHAPVLLDYCLSDLVQQGLLLAGPNQGGAGQGGLMGPGARQQQQAATQHTGEGATRSLHAEG